MDRPDSETRRRLIETFGARAGLLFEPAALAMMEAVAESESGGVVCRCAIWAGW